MEAPPGLVLSCLTWSSGQDGLTCLVRVTASVMKHHDQRNSGRRGFIQHRLPLDGSS